MECRLCLDAVLDDASCEDAQLVFPCTCAAPVHVGCLRKWQAVQAQQHVDERRSTDESEARTATCEVCGARLITAGRRTQPFASTAICRAHGGFGKVALRRVPTLSRNTRNFSEFSASEGQQLEVLEQDSTGEFFRVRALKAHRYREEGTIAVAEGWIRHTYLEWPSDCEDIAAASTPAPRMPPAYSGGAAEELLRLLGTTPSQEEEEEEEEPPESFAFDPDDDGMQLRPVVETEVQPTEASGTTSEDGEDPPQVVFDPDSTEIQFRRAVVQPTEVRPGDEVATVQPTTHFASGGYPTSSQEAADATGLTDAEAAAGLHEAVSEFAAVL